MALAPRLDADAAAGRRARGARCRTRRRAGAGRRARRAIWQAWRERWKGLRGWFLSTGHEPPQAELLRARARAAIPQLLGAIAALNERRSGRSDRSADFRVLASWFAACAERRRGAPAGARRVRAQSGAALLARSPTRMPSCRPARPGPRRRRCASTRACANTARRRRAGRCRGCATAARHARCWRASWPRKRGRWRRRAGASPPAGRRACRSSASSTRTRSACSWACSARRWPSRPGPDATVERQTGDGLLHIRLEPLGRRQPRRDRHAARRVRGPRPSDHHHADAG